MSGLAAPSVSANVWPRTTGLSAGPIPLGGGPTGMGNFPPPIPQAPLTPFPSIRPSLGPANSLASNSYATPNPFLSANPVPGNLVQNPIQTAQNDAHHRRLMQLEDENSQRITATANLNQLGVRLLEGQMDVQEQVLQYQYMLEQCMETLDHQNYILNEQAEELALLRAKMRHFEYLMDAFKYSKEGSHLLQRMSREPCYDDDHFSCCGDPIALPPPSTSPFFAGGPTRATPSTFQPFNPRYRSPNSRATTAAHLNARRTTTPTTTNRNLPAATNRPSRRFGNLN